MSKTISLGPRIEAPLMTQLRNATPQLTPEQETDAVFAKLELVELLAGIRTLGQCPGLKAMAEHIRKHEGK
jgi:hypothetical protein